ncbi:hypothetical protein ACS0TY_024070 [Phlomoides rotata]
MLLKGMEFDTAHFITDVSGKYPRLWALKGAHPVTVNSGALLGETVSYIRQTSTLIFRLELRSSDFSSNLQTSTLNFTFSSDLQTSTLIFKLQL